jgi:ABC-type multidrug transport system fused ATPase/permease subunit
MEFLFLGNGLDSMIVERGRNFSVGEKQVRN